MEMEKKEDAPKSNSQESSSETEKPVPNTSEDKELSDLLDSALADFNPTTTKSKQKKKSEDSSPENIWNEEFLKQTTAKFEQNIQTLLSTGESEPLTVEQLSENITRLTGCTSDSEYGTDSDFSNAIAETLRSLSENAESLQSQLNDTDLMNMLGSFGHLSDSNDEGNELIPFMQQMMQSLLSKEVLYPALNSILEKYPQWLEDNKGRISESEYERYSKQLKIMNDVCEELEKETPNDSPDVKRERFERILMLMQMMQECGQPPTELAGDLGPMLNLDGNPQLPADFGQNQCSVM